MRYFKATNPQSTRHVSTHQFGEGPGKSCQCSALLAKTSTAASWHMLTSSGHLGQGGGGSIFCSLIPGLFISPEAGLVSFQRKRQKNSNQCVRLSIEGSELYNSTQSFHPREDLDRDAVFLKSPDMLLTQKHWLPALENTHPRHLQGTCYPSVWSSFEVQLYPGQ